MGDSTTTKEIAVAANVNATARSAMAGVVVDPTHWLVKVMIGKCHRYMP